ncbi:hypothetical protein DOM22_16410 [Bdellovibrio sp. ZAP7]|uniref:hypothetical protein n=1 Tax=Bdellovibrio sp. ZAP7 TaxID=2231053 RepID=UPI00115C3013|nr:hypothetical protein [Bdellovibrio sp. ZAP7]QDK46624.1 hypothetical protein DOM22_16410 [Bdellovibrio sp. ZAP7]
MNQNLKTTEDLLQELAHGQSCLENEVAKILDKGASFSIDGMAIFYFGMELTEHIDQMDWPLFFQMIEKVLSDNSYQQFRDDIRTNILESLSNLASNGSMPTALLIAHVGPIAREYLRAYELQVSGKTIF